MFFSCAATTTWYRLQTTWLHKPLAVAQAQQEWVLAEAALSTSAHWVAPVVVLSAVALVARMTVQ